MWYPKADMFERQVWEKAIRDIPDDALLKGVARINARWNDPRGRLPKAANLREYCLEACGKKTQYHPTQGHRESTFEELGYTGRGKQVEQGKPTESSKDALEDRPVPRVIIEAAQRIRTDGKQVPPHVSERYYLATVAAYHECGEPYPLNPDDIPRLDKVMRAFGKQGGDIAWWLEARENTK